MDTKIPVIDLANFEKGQPTVEQTIAIGKACLEFGFFYVVNHGIGEELKGKVFEKLWQFFNLSTEKKGEIHRRNGFRGYFTKGEEHSIEYGCVEWKEGIYYFREFNVPQGRRERVFCGSNPWPNDEYVPRFQTVIGEYFEKTQALASKLLGCMAIFLGLERDFFNKEFTNDPFAQIAMFHYPPHPTSKDYPEVWGVGRHTDYGMLTVLLQDDVGGLEVETKDGLWMDVPPVPGSLVINIGDMVEIWTNGAFKAPPHRVKLSATNHRLSVAMFYEPGFESVISPIPVDKALIPLEKSMAKPSLTFPIRYGDYVLSKYCSILPENKP